MMKTTLTLMASLALGLGIATADDKKNQAAKPGDAKPELWKQYDLNGDGHLCEKEREEIRKAIVKRRGIATKLQKGARGPGADANARQPGAERGADAKAALLKQFDKNGDGELCDAERAEAKKAMAARMAEVKKRRAEAGDGKKPRPEGAKPADRKKVSEAMLKRFDKNGDGELCEAERAEAKKAMMEARGGRERAPKKD